LGHGQRKCHREVSQHAQEIVGNFTIEMGRSVAHGFDRTAVGQSIAKRPLSAEIVVFLQNTHCHREQRLVWLVVSCGSLVFGDGNHRQLWTPVLHIGALFTTELNVELGLAPTWLQTTIWATNIRAEIRPYSIAVTPPLSH
jgi:hypothetical protein